MTDREACPDRYSVPGHDRNCLRAMWSQAGHGINPLTQVQVRHLLMIAWLAGATAEHEAVHEGVTDVGEPVAPKQFKRQFEAARHLPPVWLNPPVQRRQRWRRAAR